MTRDRRAVLLGGVVVLTAWITLRAAPAAIGTIHNEEVSTEQRAQLLQSARAKVGRLHEIGDSILSMDRIAEGLPRSLLAGRDPETAEVDLMRRLRAELASDHLALKGFEPHHLALTSGPLGLAAITVRVETDFAELVDVIARLERNPALAIDSFAVIASDPESVDPEQPERLEVAIGVSGWYRALEAADSGLGEGIQ